MKKSIVLLVMSLFVFLPTLATAADLEVHMVKVGDGRSDCFIVRTPNNVKMIIDCPDGGKNTLVNTLSSLGINQVKYVVGTHEHSDHIGGLDDFLNSGFSISNTQIYYPYGSINADGGAYINLKNAAAARGMTVKKLKRGDYILNTTYDSKPLQIRALHPTAAFGDDTGADCYANEASLVLKVRYGIRSILFMGDAMNTAEASIVDDSSINGELANPQVLKVGHHGKFCGNNNEFWPCSNKFMNNLPNLNRALVTCGEIGTWTVCRDQLQYYDVRYWTTGTSGGYVCLYTDGSGGWNSSRDPEWMP